ncbi:MAG: hypothetical protein Q9208_001121 [Pyrenodesmia sp. 3 TL-2023]
MEPASLTACLAAARVTLDIVLQVKHKYEQWSDSSFGIKILHSDISSAEFYLSQTIPDIGPRLPFVSVDLFNAVTTNFETCQEALSRITDAAKHLKSESKKDRLKVVWNEKGLDRQQHHLKTQLENLKSLIEFVRDRQPQRQEKATASRRPPLPRFSNGQWTDAGLQEDSDDDVLANPLLDTQPPRGQRRTQGRRGRRSLLLRTSKKASRALIQAALIGDVTEMESQWGQNPDVNYQSRKQPPDNDAMTALHAAAKGGHYRAVEFLVQHDANVNALMINGFTPLHLAASAHHTEAVRYLIDNGADVNAQDAQGQTPLFKSDGQVTRMLRAARANPNVKDNNVNTPLHCAAFDNHLEAIKVLKEANLDVNIRNREGKTALWLVCDRADEFNVDRSLEIMDTLLRRKANPNIACHQGRSPLELCIRKDQSKLVDCLIRSRADANFRTTDGDTLLHLAATLRSREIMCQLLGFYTNIDTPCQSKHRTPLHKAIAAESSACTEQLLQLGASTTATDRDWRTALHIAAEANTDQFVQILLQNNANLYAKDEVYRTPLFYVYRSPATMSYLLNGGASFVVLDRWQNSPLHHLVRKADPAVVRVLLEHGASVLVTNRAGRTPLEELCADEEAWTVGSDPPKLAKRSLEMLQLLVKHKASVTSRCRAYIAGWTDASLGSALTERLPWRTPAQILADSPGITVAAGICVVAASYFRR